MFTEILIITYNLALRVQYCFKPPFDIYFVKTEFLFTYHFFNKKTNRF